MIIHSIIVQNKFSISIQAKPKINQLTKFKVTLKVVLASCCVILTEMHTTKDGGPFTKLLLMNNRTQALVVNMTSYTGQALRSQLTHKVILAPLHQSFGTHLCVVCHNKQNQLDTCRGEL